MILIKNAYIITQNKNREKIEGGAIFIEKDKIKAIGKSKKIEKEYSKKAKKIIDGKNQIVLPGLINCHNHLAMALLRGYADDLSLENWWTNYVYPVESKFTKKDVYLGSILSMIEMIKSGTTCFADFYYYENEVAKAAKKIGMRGVLGCAVLDLPNFEYKKMASAFKIINGLIKDLKENPLLTASLAPHMFQTTSLATYQEAKKIARRNNLILQTHSAETKKEVNFCLKKYKQRPIEVLSNKKILDKKTLLTHCCWLNKKEIKILADSRASVVHCPASNLKLASGIMPLPQMIKAGINVALGTDSPCSNNNLDMLEEMKTAALIHKGYNLNPLVADAQTVMNMATINGAKALGLEKEIGSLETGKKADIIILDFYKPHLIPVHNIVSHLVYSANGSDVKTTIINGKIIMENRKIKTINENKILNKIKNQIV